MRHRFTVIEGGAGIAAGADTVVDGPFSETTVDETPVTWRIDLRRAIVVGADEVAAWRALLIRAGGGDSVHADPDYLLSAAQHQSGGRDILFALAWAVGSGPDRLAAVVPLALPHTLWGHSRIVLWQPHGVTVAPVFAAETEAAVREALTERLRELRPRATLALAPVARPDAKAVVPASHLRAVAPRASIPAHSLVGVRSLRAPVPARVERISDPYAVRDAVEAFLLLDAEVSSAPIIGDPSEAAMVRVVTRLFAQRRQAMVELTRRDGAVVAATLILGTGAGAVRWRHAEGDVAPERIDRLA
ncbi:hypothetical protein [Methylobacterium sp. J-068]|uniref:hypothetical protein n=1 Tax=Methylobacterium sp. J-068 TaxID=2836649 RepID=UPI001FB8969B|nr:hypothetical protein [Methylobacterium sp. J-068]MCJ2036722.1 hypothetical protein [Methylobacterium sp. J-068]